MKVSFRRKPESSGDYQKVACIKAFRALTGKGLKEAKDAIEDIMEGGHSIRAEVRAQTGQELMDNEYTKTLIANGIVVGGVTTKQTVILEAIRSSAKLAMDAKEYDLATALTKVLKDFDV